MQGRLALLVSLQASKPLEQALLGRVEGDQDVCRRARTVAILRKRVGRNTRSGRSVQQQFPRLRLKKSCDRIQSLKGHVALSVHQQ
jgi:hypothetical protein